MSSAHDLQDSHCQRDRCGRASCLTRSALILAVVCFWCGCALQAATDAVPGEQVIADAPVVATDVKVGSESDTAAPSSPQTSSVVEGAASSLTQPVQPAQIAPIGYSVLRVLGAMMVVVGICFGGAWMLRGWQRRTALQGRAPRLRILEFKSLGNRQALYVVAYDQQRLLLGTSPGGVTLLSQLPEEPASLEPVAPRASFADALSQVLARSS